MQETKSIVSQRASEPRFLRDLAERGRNALPHRLVLRVGRFMPGDEATYASAYAITITKLSPPLALGPESAVYSTHCVVYNDETNEFSSIHGNYNMTWTEAVADLQRR